jgi:hypothetical protein
MGIESPFDFPTSFPIKVMGLNEADFEELVTGIVRHHVDELDIEAVSRQASRGGKYISITVRFQAESRAQLDAIYGELSSHARVLMML